MVSSSPAGTKTGADQVGGRGNRKKSYPTGDPGHCLSPPSRGRSGRLVCRSEPLAAPGHYKLSFDVPTLGLKVTPKLVQVSPKAYQTSANASQSLSAAYVLEEPASKTITSSVIDVTLQATNTGQGVWLAEAKDERGKVRMGWRWYKGSNGVPFKEGREDLPYDVFPGQTYRFKSGD